MFRIRFIFSSHLLYSMLKIRPFFYFYSTFTLFFSFNLGTHLLLVKFTFSMLVRDHELKLMHLTSQSIEKQIKLCPVPADPVCLCPLLTKGAIVKTKNEIKHV
jgi:hypothetical protein